VKKFITYILFLIDVSARGHLYKVIEFQITRKEFLETRL